MITFAEVVEKVEEMDKQLQSTTAAVAGDSYGPSRYEMIEAMRIMERRLRDLEEEVQRHEDGLVALFMQTDDIPAAAAPVPAPPRVDDPYSTKVSTWISPPPVKVNTGIGTPPADDNTRMVRVHDRGKGKMFIPDDEFNAYVNDLILDDMKRCAPERAAVASAHNTLSGALAPSPAGSDSGPVLCPNCGMEMWWNDYEHFYECGRDGCPIENIYFSHATDVVDAAAIVRRMRGAR